MTAEKKTVPNVFPTEVSRKNVPASQTQIPAAAPTSGKKHIACFIFFSFHSTLGIGSLEYIENAITIDCNKDRIVFIRRFSLLSGSDSPTFPGKYSRTLFLLLF